MSKPGLRRLVSLVFPITCVGCDEEGEWLCTACQKDLLISRSEQCVLCAKAATDGLCERCRRQTQLDGVVSLFAYKDRSVQKLIKQIKYRGHTDALYFLSEQFRRKIQQRLPRGEWQASFVPMSRERLTERGFNQSLLLAKLLCRDDLTLVPLVEKSRPTAAQASLNKNDRLKNLRRSFRLTTPLVPEKVILFDDVITTGTTLSEIARLLKKKGTKEVWAVTIAHG